MKLDGNTVSLRVQLKVRGRMSESGSDCMEGQCCCVTDVN